MSLGYSISSDHMSEEASRDMDAEIASIGSVNLGMNDLFNNTNLIDVMMSLSEKDLRVFLSANDEGREKVIRNVWSQMSYSHDPNHEIDTFDDISNYIDSLPGSYIGEVFYEAYYCYTPMIPECRLSLCIPVAAYQEGDNIYRTLKSFSAQTADPKSYEIVLNVNFPEEDPGREGECEKTLNEIDRFMSDYPEITVTYSLSPQVRDHCRIGFLRRKLTDSVLIRYLDRGDNHDHLLVRADADIHGVHREYVENFLKLANKYPKVDSFHGQLDFALEDYALDPLSYFGHRFFTTLEAAMRIRGVEENLCGGANVAFRAGSYACVGGYFPTKTIAEDVNLDRRMVELRKGSKNHQAMMYAGSKSRLFSSARRGMAALSFGYAPIEQWGIKETSFGPDNEEIRKGAIRRNKGSYGEILEDKKGFLKDVELIINRTIDAYSASSYPENKEEFVLDVLSRFGLKCEFELPDWIQIRDGERFLKKMSAFPDQWRSILERTTGIEASE